MDTLRMLLAPLACALLGWLFGLGAGQLLFRPHTPVRLGPWRMQGLLPSRRAALARELGALLERKLLTAQDLTQALDSEEFRASLRRSVDAWVDRLMDKDSRLGSLASLLLSGSARESFRQGLAERLETLSSRLAEAAAQSLSTRMDLGRLVEERLTALPLAELEDLLTPLLRRDLRRMALAMSGLGFVLGWVQVVIAAL